MRVFVKVLTVKNGEGEPIRDARWPKCFQICLYFFGNLDFFYYYYWYQPRFVEILKSARTRIKSATDSLRGSGEPRMVLQIPIFLHQFWVEQVQWKCGDCFATNMKVISLICIETRREKARSLVGGPEAALESGFGGWGEGRRGNEKEERAAWRGAEGCDLCAGKNKQVDALLLMLLFPPGGLLQKGRII